MSENSKNNEPKSIDPNVGEITERLLATIDADLQGGCRAQEEDIRDLARVMSVPVLARLKAIALHGPDTAAVRAAELILDRAWGRPYQKVVNVRSGVVVLPEKEIDELRRIEG